MLIPIFIHDFLCIHPFNDGNGRMSRLLTTLLLYRSGFEVGRYISLESQIEKTKQEYYDALEASSVDWRMDNHTPMPFIEYLLGVILAAYRDFEARVNVVGTRTTKSDQIVKNAIQSIIGKFDKNDIMERCPSLGRATIENALTKLVNQGVIERHGVGRAIYYTRKD
ncbi:MAG: Fic family protein [Clostridiales bacterium]|nr:Fic family protein [Clostridiales bacterium]